MREGKKNIGMRNQMEKWKNEFTRYVITTLLVFAMFVMHGITVSAQVMYQNGNGYEVVIEDDMNLLSLEEIRMLQRDMEPITEYGNVAFKSVASSMSTDRFAENYYDSLWGHESGTVFVIDMNNRKIYIYSKGTVYRTITKSYANTITDNVYTYASSKDYYTCAAKAYEQMYTLLEGGRIAQPMKYLSNAFLAIVISFVLLYFVVKVVSAAKKPSESELLKGLMVAQSLDNIDTEFVKETKTYSPQSSDGGGGSGGGGGGGSSGGGGGHSF